MGQTQIKKTVASRLKEARIRAGYLTAEEFCQQYNFSVSQYKQHECGERTIRASTAIRYCKTLHITLNWLLLGDNATTHDSAITKPHINRIHH